MGQGFRDSRTWEVTGGGVFWPFWGGPFYKGAVLYLGPQKYSRGDPN